MGPLNGVDTVDLHEAHVHGQIEQPWPSQLPGGRTGEAMQVEEQTARVLVGDVGDCVHPTWVLMHFFNLDLWMTAMSQTLYHRIYEVVRHIPPGRVATYGQVAVVVGPPVTARQVGDAMAALRDGSPGPSVPWQRVINAQGQVSTGRHQQQLLEQEGVVFNAKGCTDL